MGLARKFHKIIILGDNDEPGLKARKEICSRLGTFRAYYIQSKEEDIIVSNTCENSKLPKDPNEMLYYFGKRKVLEYINNILELDVYGIFDLAVQKNLIFKMIQDYILVLKIESAKDI